MKGWGRTLMYLRIRRDSKSGKKQEQHSVARSHIFSSADPDPVSGAYLSPVSGIRNRFFPDPGYRISKPILCNGWEHYVPYRCL
jgi:hypothetical protein